MLDPRWELAGGYSVDAFAQQTAVTSEDIVGMWTAEGVLAPEEARRRASEVLLVATDREQQLAGVCTAYLQRSEQLRAEMWYFRAFVASAHRQSNLAVTLALRGRDHLVDRYKSGEDTRGLGIIFEVENRGLQRAFPAAQWMPTDFTFIAESPTGAHVRVHYFPGALAPEPY